MTLDPRTPVIVGIGQISRRPSSPDEALEPVDLMAEATRAAVADTGADGLLRRVQSVRVVEVLSWRYHDPAALVAERIGASPRETVVSTVGGNSPQMLVNRTAASIRAGELDVAVITGAESMYSRFKSRVAGGLPPWTSREVGHEPSRRLGDDRDGTNEDEKARGLTMPVHVYPLFENALRAAAGETVAEHQRKVAGLWSRFSEVAASNPYAWTPTARSTEEIATANPGNRMVAFPYTKFLNANMQVDQGATLILCSVEAARAAGIASDRWVFPLAGAEAHDHWWVSNRWDLASSPAIAACGRAVLGLAGRGIDDVAHADVYSCFPAAVQIGAAALGLPLDDPARPLTVTGGLGFAGGPGNNYVTHSIAAIVERARQDPGSIGLVTALGWYITKHAVGLYSTEPPAQGFGWSAVQDEVDKSPSRVVAPGHQGDVTIETSTVVFERDGSPSFGIVGALLADGRRTWCNTRDAATMQLLMSEGTAGRAAKIAGDGDVHLS
jgi:acetyl-CoA C-acetyltransferase